MKQQIDLQLLYFLLDLPVVLVLGQVCVCVCDQQLGQGPCLLQDTYLKVSGNKNTCKLQSTAVEFQMVLMEWQWTDDLLFLSNFVL